MTAKRPFLTRLLSAVLLLPASALGSADESTPIERVRQAMRDQDYKLALELARETAGSSLAGSDELVYLEALAHFELGQFDSTITSLQPLLRRRADSTWYYKARFRAAEAMVQLRRYKDAQAIYEEEAQRLLSADRKREIAQVLVDFGDELATEPEVNDIGGIPADFKRAYTFYQRALAIEIGRDLQDDVLFKLGAVALEADEWVLAIQHFREYLERFDPHWTGPVGSVERMRGQLRQTPPSPGKHVLQARYKLGKAQLEIGEFPVARQNFEDLQRRLQELPSTPSTLTLQGNTAWQVVRTHALPHLLQPSGLERGIKAARDFLSRYPDHRHSVEAAWLIAQALQSHERHDEAVEAYQRFVDASDFQLPSGEAADMQIGRLGKSARQLQHEWTEQAVYQIGEIRFQQARYQDAIDQWDRCIGRFPNGSLWATCQQRLIDARYISVLQAVSEERLEIASGHIETFLQQHPLDPRAPQIMFLQGQMLATRASKAKEEPTESGDFADLYRHAIGEWSKLISKYPGTEEAGFALYRSGVILEEQLADHTAALEAYRRLDWGNYASAAQFRVEQMIRKTLQVQTERIFRTNETPKVRVDLRNIPKLIVRQYFLDPDAYFRKTHSVRGVEELDIGLIEPDATWQIDVDGYANYQPTQQDIEIPFDGTDAGVCIIKVSDDEHESTTLVVRSDLDLIVRSSRQELLVYVQNMVDDTPAADVPILISNGSAILASERTADDGVYRGLLDELSEMNQLSVFAALDGHIAFNQLGLDGLESSRGLNDRGYIYCDRHVYQPGQTVHVKGIIRTVAEGSYQTPEDQPYRVAIRDLYGRLLQQHDVNLSSVGTFDLSFRLADDTMVGDYTIGVSAHDDEEPRDVSMDGYSGSFIVEEFVLQKVRLRLDFDDTVFYRGQTINGLIVAEYDWGAPVAGRTVTYRLPDGRSFQEATDEQGRLAIEFDTTGMSTDTLIFQASLDADDVHTTRVLHLPDYGFKTTFQTPKRSILAETPFDLVIQTSAPDESPVGRELTVLVLERQEPIVNAALAQFPWHPMPETPVAETTVQEHTIATDLTTGRATLQLTLTDGGDHVIRVTGVDRFDQIVTAETTVNVSDAEDATRLRLFATSDTLAVGESTTVRLHSREPAGLALITWEGETILAHRVMTIEPGFNTLPFDVGHEHFPNFAISVSMMSGQELHATSRGFDVHRQLHVSITPPQEPLAPGEEAEIDLRVTDQLGEPVQAELSLALVEEALFDRFEDWTPDIVAFFQDDARRHCDFRVDSSNRFRYAGRCDQVQYPEQWPQLDLDRSLGDIRQQASRGQTTLGTPAARMPPPKRRRSAGRADNGFGGGGGGGGGNIFGDIEDVGSTVRQERIDAGWWSPNVVTDANGQATVTIPMPEKTAAWRLTARGVTPQTLVGSATSAVVTQRDFFLELKTPRWAMEGDRLAVHADIHNLVEYRGKAQVTLLVTDGDNTYASQRQIVEVGAENPTSVLFEAIEIPATGQIELTASVQAGTPPDHMQDSLRRSIDVRPWGLPYAVHGGGVADGDVALDLQLPADQVYDNQWLTIALGPDLQQVVIDMALGSESNDPSRPTPRAHPCSNTGSQLLQALGGLAYARQVTIGVEDHVDLKQQVRMLVSRLVQQQLGSDENQGGWGWPGSDRSDWTQTAVNVWALQQAVTLDIHVAPPVLEHGRRFLRQAYQRTDASDHAARAIILHALSTGRAAEFELANGLYRHRGQLDARSLALLALTMANLDRQEMAGQLLQELEKRAIESPRAGRVLCHWSCSDDRHTWLGNDVDTTAVALLAYLHVSPESPRVAQAAEYLINQRGVFGYQGGHMSGAATLAVGQYLARGRFASNDLELEILVNDEPVARIKRQRDARRAMLEVPSDVLVDGLNRIRINMTGRGRYAYAATLQGFSSTLEDPMSWTHPHVHSRRYVHAALTYRHAPIKARSTSPVGNIELGQRIEVRVDLDTFSNGRHLMIEEPLPAGLSFVPGSLQGRADHYELSGGRLLLYFRRGSSVRDFSYELVGTTTGRFRVLPTVIRDAVNPGLMRLGTMGELQVLAPGQTSDDPYQMNDGERFALGQAYFDDGRYEEALRYLSPIREHNPRYQERDVARMLLWIHTSDEHFDARRVVDAFEILTVRYPQLTIPFDKIQVVGKAYRYIGEFERAWLVNRAIIDSSFLTDSSLSAILQDEGQLLGSIDFQESLWWQYPDTPQVTGSHFALSQLLYENLQFATQLAQQQRQMRLAVPGRDATEDEVEQVPSRVSMLRHAMRLLQAFRVYHPSHPLCDDAAFSLTNAMLDLKHYEHVVEASGRFAIQYDSSEFASSFQYMKALGHFWMRDYEPALLAAQVVAEGRSDDRSLARYILGQIFHAQGRPSEAIDWYETVSSKYVDAEDAIDYFRAKRISLPEVSTFKPGESVELHIDCRNIEEVSLQVYRVDLMKLYLQEKSLSNIRDVNLAGITPQVVKQLDLSQRPPFEDLTIDSKLELEEEGAYLVMARGDDLFASGLVLITPLIMEIQEHPPAGTVRVNVIDTVSNLRPAEVEVKAIGTANARFSSGETDLRGVFVTHGIRGKATCIARDADSRYAFYRGTSWLGDPPKPNAASQSSRQAAPIDTPTVDYLDNVQLQNSWLQRSYNDQWDQTRRSGKAGVQVDQAR